MKLYLKRNLPEGQRHCVVDPVTGQIKYPGYLLFPDKCINEIPDNDAERLLEQDGHIISKEPNDFENFSSNSTVITMETIGPKDEPEEFVIDEIVIGTLQQIAGMSSEEFKGLSKGEITSYGHDLGVAIPVNIKKAERLRVLDNRCKELAAQVKTEDIKEEVAQPNSDYGEEENK